MLRGTLKFSSMQLFRRFVPSPMLTGHPKKMSLLVKHGVDSVDMPIW